MAIIELDLSGVEADSGFSPIPAGVYVAQISASDIKPLRSGNGQALQLTFDILEGEYRNRKLFANLNYQHSNKDAENIAKRQIKALTAAIGIQPGAQWNTSDLHMRPLKIRVKIRKDETGQWGDKNEVTGFEALAATGQLPGMQAPAPSRQPAASQPATPWGAR